MSLHPTGAGAGAPAGESSQPGAGVAGAAAGGAGAVCAWADRGLEHKPSTNAQAATLPIAIVGPFLEVDPVCPLNVPQLRSESQLEIGPTGTQSETDVRGPKVGRAALGPDDDHGDTRAQ